MEQPEKLQQSKEKPYSDYVILGIGEGGGGRGGGADVPVIEMFESVSSKIRKGATYISLEKLETQSILNGGGSDLTFEKLLSGYVKERSGKARSKERHFVVGDANEIPLRDNSVDEIWITNVFGDSNASVDKRTFKEVARVLKQNGRFFVLETYTPVYAAALFDLETETQFGLAKETYQGDALFKKLSELGITWHEQTNIMLYAEEETPFLLVFTKTESNQHGN